MKRLAIIGCGARSNCYMRQLRDGLGNEWKVVALADPRTEAVEAFRKNFADDDTKAFACAPELLTAMDGDLDAAIIASPNSLHLESLLPAMAMKLTILLEKPVAVTTDHCAAMWKSYVATGRPPVAVGFVLRYTTFYRKVKDLIDDGAVGQVLSIEAGEFLGPPLTSMFMRGWRRLERLAGPFILEKCCHDMDLLNWFVGSRVSKISSFAGRTRFLPKPEAAMQCRNCSLTDSCRYAICERTRDDDDLCVYNSDKDIPDHQVVNIEYENGVLAAFTACMDQPRSTRTLRVNGTCGRIEGDIGADELRLYVHAAKGSDRPSEERFELVHDDTGHHGGDSVIADQFKSMLRGEADKPLAGLQEGVDACLVALAAERSRQESRIVTEDEIYVNALDA